MGVKTGTIIIARMGSSRFPGKVVAPLYGRPVIAWLIDKGKDLGTDEVIVATSYLDEDDPIEAVCKAEGCRCYRGHPTFVAQRVWKAYEEFGLTHAMEFSGDSPFTDFNAAAIVLEGMIAQPYFDIYVVNNYPVGIIGVQSAGHARTYYEKLVPLMEEDPDFEEHQETAGHFANKHTRLFSTWTIDMPGTFSPYTTPLNLCVDYPLQLWILNRVCEEMGAFPYDYRDVEEFFKTHKEL